MRVGNGAAFKRLGLLAERLIVRLGRRRRDVVVETVDGERAAGSRWVGAFREAGFKGMGTGLRYYVGF